MAPTAAQVVHETVMTRANRWCWPPPPAVWMLGRRCCSFHLFGVFGLAASVAAMSLIGRTQGLSQIVLCVLVTLACLTFLALASITKRVIGSERLVYYHHQIAILITLTMALALLRLPVLRYLDAAAVGLGVFLFFGRLGCCAVGCCYGRPTAWGWRYGREHVIAGFPVSLEGVPLLPAQAIEAVAVLATALTAGALQIGGAPEGSAFRLYLAGYALIRFAIEFHRGDPQRPHARGWTEAQWTSLAILAAVLCTYSPWLLVLPAAAAIAGVRSKPDWLGAAHIAEIVRVLRDSADSTGVVVRDTRHGLRLSRSALPDGRLVVGLSAVRGVMGERETARVLELILLLERDTTAPTQTVTTSTGTRLVVVGNAADPGLATSDRLW